MLKCHERHFKTTLKTRSRSGSLWPKLLSVLITGGCAGEIEKQYKGIRQDFVGVAREAPQNVATLALTLFPAGNKAQRTQEELSRPLTCPEIQAENLLLEGDLSSSASAHRKQVQRAGRIPAEIRSLESPLVPLFLGGPARSYLFSKCLLFLSYLWIADVEV